MNRVGWAPLETAPEIGEEFILVSILDLRWLAKLEHINQKHCFHDVHMQLHMLAKAPKSLRGDNNRNLRSRSKVWKHLKGNWEEMVDQIEPSNRCCNKYLG